MNQTEAWETVLHAATLLYQVNTTARSANGRRSRHVYLDVPGQKEPANLLRALSKVSARVHRMRSRLDHARARRAGKPKCPKGLEP